MNTWNDKLHNNFRSVSLTLILFNVSQDKYTMLLLSLLSMDWAITGVIMIVVFYLTSVYLRDRRLRSFLPPGPVAWPLVGNLPQIIGQDLHIALTNLADIFGNLVWMKMGSENVLVVNSMDAAVASLVRQGKVFSGRPRKRKTVEVLLGEGKDIVMNDVLPELKIHRRIVHSFLSSQTHSDKDRLKHIILNESRSLEDKMKTFSSESVSFDPKFQVARVVANVLCQCILSRRFDDVDEQFHEQLRIVQDIVDNIESFNIVDVIPWLEVRWIFFLYFLLPLLYYFEIKLIKEIVLMISTICLRVDLLLK